MLCQSKCTDHQELPQFSILHIECNVFVLPMNDAYILQNQDRLLYIYDIFFKLLWIDSHLIVLTLSFLLTNPFQHLHVAIFPNHVNLNNSLYTIFETCKPQDDLLMKLIEAGSPMCWLQPSVKPQSWPEPQACWKPKTHVQSKSIQWWSNSICHLCINLQVHWNTHTSSG